MTQILFMSRIIRMFDHMYGPGTLYSVLKIYLYQVFSAAAVLWKFTKFIARLLTSLNVLNYPYNPIWHGILKIFLIYYWPKQTCLNVLPLCN